MNKKIELPVELLKYVLCWDHIAWTNDFEGWDGDQEPLNEVEGFSRKSAMEGHKLIAENGNEYCPQYSYLRKGNHLRTVLKSKDSVSREWEKKADVELADFQLFRDYEVVIQTSGEKIEAFAPVLDNKDDAVVFISLIENCYREFKEQGLDPRSEQKNYIEQLTLFLYKNNPKKKKEQSIFDQLD